MLEPASPRAILLRMLNNIRLVHANERRFRLAALACEKMLRIDPDHPQHERDLGYLLLAAGDTEDAVAHLDAYLEHAPEATDYAEVRARREEAAEEPPPPPI
jgi:regulator of sirC expression with transglutaminase-like and TPR domain